MIVCVSLMFSQLIHHLNLQLSKKSLDETEVERDFSIRRKIKALYNKKESDFSSVDEYKNYEEMVEDIVYNLVNLVDVEATNQRIEKYKQDNSKEIVMNQFRRKEELKGESITIKEREEEIASANQKFQVRLLSGYNRTRVQFVQTDHSSILMYIIHSNLYRKVCRVNEH